MTAEVRAIIRISDEEREQIEDLMGQFEEIADNVPEDCDEGWAAEDAREALRTFLDFCLDEDEDED